MFAAFATVLSCVVISSYAIPFTGSVLGQWTDVVSNNSSDIYSVNNNDAVSTASFNWGEPATTTFDNQFTFDGLSFADVEENTAFAIGNFTYRNGSTYYSEGISGVSMDLSLQITNPLNLSDVYDFSFSIVGTPNNSGDSIIDGDIVSALNGYSSSNFTYNGINYTLNLLGFSSDGGATIRSDFSSAEGATQSAQLFARITSEIPSVPEPSSFSFLISGIVALCGFSIFRKKSGSGKV